MNNRKTIFPGVRVKEHPTKKRGFKPLRYFSIYYRVRDENGKSKVVEEGLGWENEKPLKDESGNEIGWTPEKALKALLDLKEKHRLAESTKTLKAMRKDIQAKEKANQLEAKKATMTFDEMFQMYYLPVAKNDKSWRSWQREESIYKIWMKKIIGDVPLQEIGVDHLEQIKTTMMKKKKAAASIRYALAVVRQTINYAIKMQGYSIDNPVQRVAKPKADNKRVRYLTEKEAGILLAALKVKSQRVHNITLLSLHCGLRFGEISSLTWADVDLKNGSIFLRDTKGGRNRHVYMTDEVKKMFRAMPRGENDALVFPGRNGKKIESISKSFDKAVARQGLNNNVKDRRQRVVFHTCRHTYASWLVQKGVDLYTVQKLLGHASITQTERYSHLAEGNLQAAAKMLGPVVVPEEGDNVIEIKPRRRRAKQ